MKSFADRLTEAVKEKKTAVLVGLDPRWEQLPEKMTLGRSNDDGRVVAEVFETFCREIIDVVAPLVPAVKPQAAFFEQYGPEGMKCLARVIRYASSKGLLVVFDGKRNDIGSTATAYAQGILGRGSDRCWSADALTVNPYMGDDSLEPFVQVANEGGSGVFVLVKTSNPGGAKFQDLVAEGEPVYRHVGKYVESLAAASCERNETPLSYGSIGAVVGATWPGQLTELRAFMPHTWFLVPGYGSQGGAARDVAGAFDENGLGALVNNSRGIIFAWRKPQYASLASNWTAAVEAATRDMIAALADETSVGRL